MTTTSAPTVPSSTFPQWSLLSEFVGEYGGASDQEYRESVLDALQIDAAGLEEFAEYGARPDEVAAAWLEAGRLRAHAGAAEEFAEWPEAFDITMHVAERWAGTADELIAAVTNVLERMGERP